jgi:hypothetical protein
MLTHAAEPVTHDAVRSCPRSITPLFATPSSSDGSEITLRSSYSLDLRCWVDGDWYAGTNRWFETLYYGMWYWVSADQIANPQPSLPHC